MKARPQDVLDVFRPKRWYRNLMLLPGALAAAKIYGFDASDSLTYLAIFLAACFVASGNYGINEVLDAEGDRHHPTKRTRAVAARRLNARFVIILSIGFYVLGIVVASLTRHLVATLSLGLLIVSGIAYNLKPIRLKDRPYIDFISEAINNPIRLMIGWYAVAGSAHNVPTSFVLGYWFFGIFLMAAKRFGELRVLKTAARATKYRLSLAHMTQERLLIAMFGSLTAFSFMLGALSLKYSVDLIVALPFVVGWVVWFLILAFEDNSIVISPERIFEKRYFVVYTSLTVVLFGLLFFTGDQLLGWVK